jgi:hypothetical protein
MNAHNGKIARLPRAIRKNLNERLDRSEPGLQLLVWLNALPEVKQVVQKKFASAPINKQNLSNWRQGGFQEWLVWRELWAEARKSVTGKLNVKSQSNRLKLEIESQKTHKPLMENEMGCGKEEASNACQSSSVKVNRTDLELLHANS